MRDAWRSYGKLGDNNLLARKFSCCKIITRSRTGLSQPVVLPLFFRELECHGCHEGLNIKRARSAHFRGNVGNYVEVIQLPGLFRVSIPQRTCNSRAPNRNMSITMPNRLYEPNESQCSPTERKILTIDPIDFHICRSDRTERERKR
jgi:hypothetical protein